MHVKLAEIYAKRQDRKALEVVAGDVFKLTQGEGPDWTRVVRPTDLDQENPLYQPGGRPGALLSDATAASTAGLAGSAMAAATTLPPDLILTWIWICLKTH